LNQIFSGILQSPENNRQTSGIAINYNIDFSDWAFSELVIWNTALTGFIIDFTFVV
jgi:hypothetical protein